MNNQPVDDRPVLACVQIPGVFFPGTPEELARTEMLFGLPDSPDAPKLPPAGSAEWFATQKS